MTTRGLGLHEALVGRRQPVDSFVVQVNRAAEEFLAGSTVVYELIKAESQSRSMAMAAKVALTLPDKEAAEFAAMLEARCLR